MAEQSLRLDGRKVCIIKRVGISQAESNKATVCALPSIHLTFGKGGKCDGAEQGDYCPFTMIAGMARVDATGGASPSPYEKREG